VREVLDRLREAESALSAQLNELYYTEDTDDRAQAIDLLWMAKQHVWYASMNVLNAAAGHQTPVPTPGKSVSYEDARAKYEADNPPPD